MRIKCYIHIVECLEYETRLLAKDKEIDEAKALVRQASEGGGQESEAEAAAGAKLAEAQEQLAAAKRELEQLHDQQAARDRALAPDLPRGAVPANALHTHWDCRYLVDLAFVSAHAKLRYGSSWQAKNSPHGSPPSSPAAGCARQPLAPPAAPSHPP